MTKSGGKSRVHFRVMQNLLSPLDSSPSSRVELSHFSSRVITRSIPRAGHLEFCSVVSRAISRPYPL